MIWLRKICCWSIVSYELNLNDPVTSLTSKRFKRQLDIQKHTKETPCCFFKYRSFSHLSLVIRLKSCLSIIHSSTCEISCFLFLILFLLNILQNAFLWSFQSISNIFNTGVIKIYQNSGKKLAKLCVCSTSFYDHF